MKDKNSQKQIFRTLNLDLFLIEKLAKGVTLLKVNITDITYEEIDLFIETIALITNDGNSNLIIDFSETESLDELSCRLLIDKIIEISTNGGSVRLIVTEDNPQLPFSINMAISKLEVYLNLKSALIDFNILKHKSR